MGQDDNCGICGKHYQTCRHYVKTHVFSDTQKGFTFCGRQTSKGLVGESMTGYDHVDTDPDDYCQLCQTSIGRPPNTGHDPFKNFLR